MSTTVEETLELRQKYELQALKVGIYTNYIILFTQLHKKKIASKKIKAIYGEDVKDLRGKKSSTPLDLIISLIPQQGTSGIHETHAKLDLHITCSETYPNRSVIILIHKSI